MKREIIRQEETMSIIEPALELAGKETKDLILKYINYRYGMDINSIVLYQEEFANYLRENLGRSAEIIISRLKSHLEQSAQTSKSIGVSVGKIDKTSERRQPQQQQPAKINRISQDIHFIICDKCFWCASMLVSEFEKKCANCGTCIPSAVPISLNEKFVVEITPKRGISMSFS